MTQHLTHSTKLRDDVISICKKTKLASLSLQKSTSDDIDRILDTLADSILAEEADILLANNQDVLRAKEKALPAALIDRLRLDKTRLLGLVDTIRNVQSLAFPVGRSLWETHRPNGLHIERVSCPIGVLGMIYESRPNVTIDAAILCLKSLNAVVLRGGSESFETSCMLHKLIQNALEAHGLPRDCVSMIPNRDRESVRIMLEAKDYIDVIVPRGGKGLTSRVMTEATMPVFSHLDGICHIFVDQDADPDIAVDVTHNAKLRRTGICGAMETLLFHTDLDKSIALNIIDNLISSGCLIVGDHIAQQLHEGVKPAHDSDWSTEYLDAKLSVKFVDTVDSAIAHINTYGSHHTDCIITKNAETAAYFMNGVDSGIVMHNASTQFADGGEFGMGAEIGIATGKLHARGPVGLEQLCTYKYRVHGNGQTRPS